NSRAAVTRSPDCAIAVAGRSATTRAPSALPPKTKGPRPTARGINLGGRDLRPVHLDGHAPLEQVDGEHEESLVGTDPHQDALHAREGARLDADAAPFLEVGMGEGAHARLDDLADGLDLGGGDQRRPVPSLTEDGHHAARLTDGDVARP